MSLEAIKCNSCERIVRPGSQFCHTCGLFVSDGYPEIFLKIERQEKKLIIVKVIIVLLTVLNAGVFMLGIQMLHSHNDLIAKVILLVAAMLLFVQILWGKRAGKFHCPACGESLPGISAKRTFCTFCGIRMRPGSGSAMFPAIPRGELESDCGFCGSKLMPEDGFCSNCGSNIGAPGLTAYRKIMEASERDLLCPACGFSVSGVFLLALTKSSGMKKWKYCGFCGSEMNGGGSFNV